MSTYEPIEEVEDGSSHDPGVKSKEVSDERELSEHVDRTDRRVRLMLGFAALIPAILMLGIALFQLFPGIAETVLETLRGIIPTIL